MRKGKLLEVLTIGDERPNDVHLDLADDLLLVDGIWVLRAIKCSYPTERPGVFAGLAGAEFGRDNVALCRRNCGSTPPSERCECGFHAYVASRFVGVPEPWKGVTLEVGMTGRVHVYADPEGVRPDVLVAERQLVLSVDGMPFEEALASWTPGDQSAVAKAFNSIRA